MESVLQEKTVPGLHAHLLDVVRTLGLPSSATILDVGCGSGAWLTRLSRSGYTNLHGIDCDRPVCAVATVQQVNIDDGGFGDLRDRYQLITAIEVVEHLENPGRLISAAARHLTADGYFLVTTPNIHSLASRLKFLVKGQLPHFDTHGDSSHVFPVLLYTFERVLARHGFRTEMRWTYPECRGGIGARRITRLGVSLLKWLPNSLPGDVLCILAKRAIA